MTDINRLRALAERLEQAEATDQEIFAHVVCDLLAPSDAEVEMHEDGDYWVVRRTSTFLLKPWPNTPPKIRRFITAEAWTDAALALVGHFLPGWDVSNGKDNASQPEGMNCWAVIRNPGLRGEPTFSCHHSPHTALAILRALVAALIAKGEAA